MKKKNGNDHSGDEASDDATQNGRWKLLPNLNDFWVNALEIGGGGISVLIAIMLDVSGFHKIALCFYSIALACAFALFIHYLGEKTQYKYCQVLFWALMSSDAAFLIVLLVNSHNGQSARPSPQAPNVQPVVMVQQPDFIEGTQVTEQQLDQAFPFGYGIIYFNDAGEKRIHELHNGLLNWKIDWDNVKIEPHYSGGWIRLSIPGICEARTDGAGIISNLNVGIDMRFETGESGYLPFGYNDRPWLSYEILNNNQKSPVVVIGFRIPSESELQQRSK